ncbi:unnamed protein product [Cyclocybe aegerita]|uniref:F-box domain-containing protein n=1 Tax=Cyclocybe aegerita TaxID=1973307 RepID=A0A8S0WF91_CYCAE|nr:unnamed protein product [Cyclocybe aegerita]
MAKSARRSKRLKEGESIQPEHVEVDTKNALKAANTKGLAIFPDELLLEILSYFPPAVLTTREYYQEDLDAQAARSEVLDALCQICSNLRRFFRPYVWQRIEVRPGMLVNGKELDDSTKRGRREYNLELLRQLEIVTIRDPALAEYVQIVNVYVAAYSVRPVLDELARCLALFTNLHTITLDMRIGIQTGQKHPVPGTFDKYQYPQIKTVYLGFSASYILPSCPEARQIYSLGDNDFKMEMALNKCPLAVTLPYHFAPHEHAALLAFPKLEKVSLNLTARELRFTNGIFNAVSSLERLEHLTLHVAPDSMRSGGPANEELKERSKELLLERQSHDKQDKTLVVCTSDSMRALRTEVIQLPWVRPQPEM